MSLPRSIEMLTNAWTTEDEIEYLKEIGTSHEYCVRNLSHREMLLKYQRGFNKRRVWNNIDRRKVQTALVKMIKAAR